MKNTLKLGIAAFALCIGGDLSAQTPAPTSTKEESVKAAEILSTRPGDTKVSDAPETEHKQEPVKPKQEAKKEAKTATPKSKETKTDSTSGPNKMAITEQGINKNNNKPKSTIITDTTTAPKKK